MIRMVCLANSWRDGGRCVAGISVRSGQWIRPVPPAGGPIPDARTVRQGRRLALLDIIDLDLARATFATRYQRENREIRAWDWQVVGRSAPESLLEYRSRANSVLHNRKKTVEPSHLEKLDPVEWRSLELLHAKDVSFVPDPRKSGRWQVRFSAGRPATRYLLSLTDPEATERLAQGGRIGRNCLLTVSLTGPRELVEYEVPPLCYKLVAAVIEL